jgi:hypothetical protein
VFPKLWADPVITFFLAPYNKEPKSPEQIKDKMDKPGKINRMLGKEYIWKSLGGVPGIFSTYAGFLQMSDLDGQMIFPLKQNKPFLYLTITQRITPIIRSGNTISHFEFESGTPTAFYSIEQKKDPETKLMFWDVQRALLPNDNHIPLETIVIFANPCYILVPEGITLTPESPNWTLPTLYVKKGIALADNALYVLNLSQYFGSLLNIYKKEKKGYISHLVY